MRRCGMSCRPVLHCWRLRFSPPGPSGRSATASCSMPFCAASIPRTGPLIPSSPQRRRGRSSRCRREVRPPSSPGRVSAAKGAATSWKRPPPQTSRPSPGGPRVPRSGSMSAPTQPKRWKSAPPWPWPRCCAPAPSKGRSWSSPRPPAPAGLTPRRCCRSRSCMAATWPPSRCNTPTFRAGCPCWSSRNMGRRRQTRCSAPSMGTGALCQRPHGRGSSCSA